MSFQTGFKNIWKNTAHGLRVLTVFSMGLLGLALWGLMAGCSTHLSETPGDFQTQAARSCPPESVALLPFENLTECPGIENLVREGFYSHLSPKTYGDIELAEVDARLKSVNATDHEAMLSIEVQEMGRLLHCDAIVYGSVTKCTKMFVGIFSQVCIAASLEVYDTRTGEKIWADQETACSQDGGVPLGLLGIPMTAVRSGMNLREVVKVRVVDDLCRTLAARAPKPGRIQVLVEEDSFELQVGAFREQKGALDTVSSLQKKGFSPYMRKNNNQEVIWFKVLLGPYESRKEAESALEKVRATAAQDAFIRNIKSP